jgi:hypothetical protein
MRQKRKYGKKLRRKERKYDYIAKTGRKHLDG